jgi:ABC-type multidrug transport system fused ATPase/permease subunit
LLLILSLTLALVDLKLTLITILSFSLVFIFSYKFINKNNHNLGKSNTITTVKVSKHYFDSLNIYRELFVSNNIENSTSEYYRLKNDNVRIRSKLLFMPNVTKYIYELSLVMFALGIGIVKFLQSDIRTAVATLTMFLVAGSRIAPALLRIQNSVFTYKNASGAGELTLSFVDSLKVYPKILEAENISQVLKSQKLFDPIIKFTNLNFAYPGNSQFKIENLNLIIQPKSLVALVGPSGGGKTTIVDLIAGLEKPLSGSISIDGKQPSEIISEFPGAIGYVPQDPYILNATIKENLTFTLFEKNIPDNECWDVLEQVGLTEVVSNLDLGIHSLVTDKGNNLSGGQKQRLAIARALIHKPRIIILDEVTSAQDPKSELILSEVFSNLKKQITVLVIAHRLHTVKEADILYYVDKGSIKGQGTFEYLKSNLVDFATQLKYLAN